VSDQIIATIRTTAATIVGTALAWLAARGVDVGGVDPTVLIALLAAVLTGVYHAAGSAAQRRWPGNPIVRHLFLVGKPPSYAPPAPVSTAVVQGPQTPAPLQPGAITVEVSRQELLDEWAAPARPADPWDRPAR